MFKNEFTKLNFAGSKMSVIDYNLLSIPDLRLLAAERGKLTIDTRSKQELVAALTDSNVLSTLIKATKPRLTLKMVESNNNLQLENEDINKILPVTKTSMQQSILSASPRPTIKPIPPTLQNCPPPMNTPQGATTAATPFIPGAVTPRLVTRRRGRAPTTVGPGAAGITTIPTNIPYVGSGGYAAAVATQQGNYGSMVGDTKVAPYGNLYNYTPDTKDVKSDYQQPYSSTTAVGTAAAWHSYPEFTQRKLGVSDFKGKHGPPSNQLETTLQNVGIHYGSNIEPRNTLMYILEKGPEYIAQGLSSMYIDATHLNKRKGFVPFLYYLNVADVKITASAEDRIRFSQMDDKALTAYLGNGYTGPTSYAAKLFTALTGQRPSIEPTTMKAFEEYLISGSVVAVVRAAIYAYDLYNIYGANPKMLEPYIFFVDSTPDPRNFSPLIQTYIKYDSKKIPEYISSFKMLVHDVVSSNPEQLEMYFLNNSYYLNPLFSANKQPLPPVDELLKMNLETVKTRLLPWGDLTIAATYLDGNAIKELKSNNSAGDVWDNRPCLFKLIIDMINEKRGT